MNSGLQLVALVWLDARMGLVDLGGGSGAIFGAGFALYTSVWFVS